MVLMALLRCYCSTGSTDTTTANRVTVEDQLSQLDFYNNKYVYLTFLCPAQVNLRKNKSVCFCFTASVSSTAGASNEPKFISTFS